MRVDITAKSGVELILGTLAISYMSRCRSLNRIQSAITLNGVIQYFGGQSNCIMSYIYVQWTSANVHAYCNHFVK